MKLMYINAPAANMPGDLWRCAGGTAGEIWVAGNTYASSIPADVGAPLALRYTGGAWVKYSPDPSFTGVDARVKDLAWFSDSDVWLMTYKRVYRWNGVAWSLMLNVSPVMSTGGFGAFAPTSATELYLVAFDGDDDFYIWLWNGTSLGSVTNVDITGGSAAHVQVARAHRYAGGGALRATQWDGTASVYAVPVLGEYTLWGGTGQASTQGLWLISPTSGFLTLNAIGNPPYCLVCTPNFGGSPAWSIMSPQPIVTTIDGMNLSGVHGVSTSDFWVAGADYHSTILQHFNGSSWTDYNPRAGATDFAGLNDVHALSSTDVWAVGGKTYSQAEGSRPDENTKMLAYHWDGVSWTEHSPPP